MNIVAFVPIKLKSQRLPDKMMLPLKGRPLLTHIFNTLLNVSKKISMDIYCYCSDETIVSHLPQGVKFLKRSKDLDENETKGMDIYKSFVDMVSADVYVLCHATSPFLSENSIIKGIESITCDGYDSAFSVSKIQTFCWFNNRPLNYSLIDIVRTQDIKPVYWETSAFYMFKRSVIDNDRRIGDNPFIVQTDRIESIDIDEREDYDLACAIGDNTN